MTTERVTQLDARAERPRRPFELTQPHRPRRETLDARPSATADRSAGKLTKPQPSPNVRLGASAAAPENAREIARRGDASGDDELACNAVAEKVRMTLENALGSDDFRGSVVSVELMYRQPGESRPASYAPPPSPPSSGVAALVARAEEVRKLHPELAVRMAEGLSVVVSKDGVRAVSVTIETPRPLPREKLEQIVESLKRRNIRLTRIHCRRELDD